MFTVAPVAIYLDTNVFRTLTGDSKSVDRASLTVLANQLGQQVVVPSLVVEEAAAARRRDLQSALDAHGEALDAVRKQFDVAGDVEFESYPDVDEAIEAWSSRLRDWAKIITTTPDHMVEGVRREIDRRPPVSVSGKHVTGARDAAIWATIRDHHQSTNEVGHFVSEDGDFAEGKSVRLKAELLAELGGREITLHKHVGSILEQLGTVSEEEPMDTEELVTKGVFALSDGLEQRPDWVVRAVMDPDSGSWPMRIKVNSANPVEVFETKAYAAGDTTVRVVDASWDAGIELIAMRPVSHEAFTVAHPRLRMRALISISDNDAALLEAQVESEQTSLRVQDNDDGTVSVSSWGNPNWHVNRQFRSS